MIDVTRIEFLLGLILRTGTARISKAAQQKADIALSSIAGDAGVKSL